MGFADVAVSLEALLEEVLPVFVRRLEPDEERNREALVALSEELGQRLRDLQRGEKFVVNVVVCERGEAGVTSVARCLWDAKSDGHVTLEREHERFLCVATLWAVSVKGG